MATHYDNLQVSPKASEAVIKASYRVLVQKYHPDRFEPRGEAERITRILNAAWDVLGNPTTRAAYDRELEARTPPPTQQRSPARKSRKRQPRPSPYNTPEIDQIVNYMVDAQDDLNEKIVERFKALMLKRRIELGSSAILDDAEETRFLQSVKDRMGIEQGMAFAEMCAFIDINMGQYSQLHTVTGSRTTQPHGPTEPYASSPRTMPSDNAPSDDGSGLPTIILFAALVFVVLVGLSRLF